ncbi:hypothetical protein [Sphingomonas montanisoli]|uniref:STAS/SEC14 domain-containing protein n=1 Tax=Sphingomonas montanisoli TaxID=2606412 RepID=A0A5D9CDA5_9SPHN|nr:hypothetical protein [Sphingomonas montanisoli]TZG29336.1 hypothetical protein FYJ91_04220 [Sphingomonas montanisoli]
MFSFVHDADANILRINVEGLYEMENVPALAAALVSAAHRAGAASDDFDVLVESLDFPLQHEDVNEKFVEIMRAGMAQTKGYAAIVVGTPENFEQASRTLLHPNLRVFMSMMEAEEWLARMAAVKLADADGRQAGKIEALRKLAGI